MILLKSMRIIHITYAFGLGGIETMLRNIANEQAAAGHEVHLIVINNSVNRELRDSLNKRIVFRCMGRRPGSKNPLPYLRLNIMLQDIGADVIHLHYSSIARFVWLPALKRRLCVTQHDVCNVQNSRFLYKCQRIYAISNVVQTDIMKWTGLKSEVVLNGIDVDSISYAKTGGNGNVFRIVQVSRLMHEKKGQHILIMAVAQLIKQGHNEVRLDLIGEGESREYLENLVVRLDLSDYVSFLGAKDQSYIYAHLCEYDLYVQPSIYEGFGLTVTEAMAAKVPVLVSENQGPLEIIDNGRFGYSFKNQDAGDCTSKIEIFLNGENDKAMIEEAFQRVHKLYDVKVTAATYLQKYKEFIDSNYAQIH